MTDTNFHLRMRGVTKKFGGLLANDRVDFDLQSGEIHALLGENGAGKSTLMNILSGFYQADQGVIEVNGSPIHIANPSEAIKAGIGMVHQHFMLIGKHTVAENIILGLGEPRFYLNTAAINRKIDYLSKQYHIPVDPGALIQHLSIGERQKVEILKLLYRNMRILILDEPTTILAPLEVKSLFATLGRLRRAGRAIVFISHKLEEVLSVSDRITVLRNGRNVATVRTEDSSAQELAEMMVGRLSVPVVHDMAIQAGHTRDTALSLEGIWAVNELGLPSLEDVSLHIQTGEIFGLLGVAGNGQKELVEVATGMRKPRRGKVTINGRDMTGAGPRRYIEAGVSHIPGDRLGVGLVSGMNITENIMLKCYREKRYSSGFFLRLSAIENLARELIRSYGILPADPHMRAGSLSGGNIQRLILARELSSSPCLLVAVYPFQGLDLGAIGFLEHTLKEQSGKGLAVLLVGEDLELTLKVSHRVGVIYEGRIEKTMLAADVCVEELGLMMAGKTTGDGAR